MKCLATVLLIAFLVCPASGQVKKTINRSSLYADSVLRQLVRASQLAVTRQRSILNQSALRENETSGIRRQSTLSGNDLAQLERLSEFAGDRLRSMEEQSEFKQHEVSRMQAAYQGGLDAPGENRLAEIAQKNSTMPHPQAQRLLTSSEAREWANGVRRRALATRGLAELLQNRSLASPARSKMILQMSEDK